MRMVRQAIRGKGVAEMKVIAAEILVIAMAIVAAIQECRLVGDTDAAYSNGTDIMTGAGRVGMLDVVLLAISAVLVGLLLV